MVGTNGCGRVWPTESAGATAVTPVPTWGPQSPASHITVAGFAYRILVSMVGYGWKLWDWLEAEKHAAV